MMVVTLFDGHKRVILGPMHSGSADKLKRRLETRIEQLGGHPPRVFRDDNFDGADAVKRDPLHYKRPSIYVGIDECEDHDRNLDDIILTNFDIPEDLRR